MAILTYELLGSSTVAYSYLEQSSSQIDLYRPNANHTDRGYIRYGAVSRRAAPGPLGEVTIGRFVVTKLAETGFL